MSNEKLTKKTRASLEVALAILRAWQWISALVIYTSFSLLFQYISRNRLGENVRMLGIVRMGRVVLAYSTLIIFGVHILKRVKFRCWIVFARASLPGDLLMIGLFIAKITVLGIAGLPADCHGLTRENYYGDDLARQPLDGFTTVRFGPGVRDNVGELDRFCHLPRTVYALCVAGIFSCTLSILLTVLQLQEHGRSETSTEKPLPNGHVEEAVPMPVPRPEIPSSPDGPAVVTSTVGVTDPGPGEVIPLETISSSSVAAPPPEPGSAETSRPCSPRSERTIDPGRQCERSDTASWRTSQDTAVSFFDPDHYLVSDGFRPPVNPPAYDSRPPSLYSLKGGTPR